MNCLGKPVGSGPYLFCGPAAFSSLWKPGMSLHKVALPVLHTEDTVGEATELAALKRQS